MAADSEPAILSSMSINGPLGATPRTGSFELTSSAPSRPTGSPSRVRVSPDRLGQLGLLGLILTSVVVALSAAHTTTLLPEFLDHSLEGPFGSVGLHLAVGTLLGVLSLMFISYLLAVRAAARLSARAVLMTIAALNAVVLLGPPLFSTDIFSYQAYAREWITYGANPYVAGPHVMALDPIYPYIGANWISTPTVYGPLFTAFSAVLAPVSIAASALAYKALAAVASMVTVALLWHGARLRGLNPVRAVALFGLNPLVVLYGVGGGHNDLILVALTTGGIYALLSHRERTSGALIMIGAATKLTGALLLPFALAAGVELGASQRRRAMLIGAGIASLATAILTFSLFGLGIFNLIPTLHQVQEGDRSSIPGFITSVFGRGLPGEIAGIILGVVFLAVFAWLLRRVWRGEMDWIDGAGWATLAMLVTASSVLPWYFSWLLPLVALCSDRRLWRWSLVLSGVMLCTTMLGFIPHGDTFLGMSVIP